jgi:UDP:flavonoid glycosyltransferase YjiC (YdhE family)
MADILFITSGLSGILNSSFELIRRLEKEGHHVTYSTLIDAREKVEQQGFSYCSLPEWHEEAAGQWVKQAGLINRFLGLLSTYTNAKKRRSEGIKRLGQESFRNTLNELRPNLVLIDIECHEYIFTTYVSSFPLLLISQWFNGQYASGLPLISTLIKPDDDNEIIERSWQNRKHRFRLQYLKKKLLSGGTDRRSLLLAYAQQIGFPVRLLKFYDWPTPFTYREIPILHFTDEQLELPHLRPSNHHYLGPMVFQGRQDRHPELQLIREKLAEIYAQKEANESKLIYCSVSTMASSNQNFLQKVVDACAQEPNWTLILALGGHPDQLCKQVLPKNIFAFSWLPQMEILAHADCSLNHAGINTINECIFSEVPMVVYSGGKYDQNGCAVRIAHHKLGVMGDREKATPQDIQQNIREVLNNPVYKSNVIKAKKRSLSKSIHGKLVEIVNTTIAEAQQSKKVDD